MNVSSLPFHLRRAWLRNVVVLCDFVSAAGGCRTVEMTGRKQLLLMPETSEITMGASAFEQTLSEEQPSTNQQYTEMVNRVGQRIANVAERPDYGWEFRVIASPQQNAFCLPGGKVAVYEGILPVCQNEAGLAVVMSHEIAHALARHGGERMSQGYVVNAVGDAVSVLTKDKKAAKRERIKQAYGVASKYGVVLPYSRKHESEADHMGLMLMAKAGYDPTEAPAFWERFAQAQQGSTPPEFLSTHPADARRADDLRELLADAIVVYGGARARYGKGDAISISPQTGLAGSLPASHGIMQTGFSSAPPDQPSTTKAEAAQLPTPSPGAPPLDPSRNPLR